MEAITKRLPLLAFVLAAFTAVAFSPKDSGVDVYGESAGIWYNVTGIAPGPMTYTCDEEEEVECLHDVNGNPINPGEDREFVKRGPLPPAN